MKSIDQISWHVRELATGTCVIYGKVVLDTGADLMQGNAWSNVWTEEKQLFLMMLKT